MNSYVSHHDSDHPDLYGDRCTCNWQSILLSSAITCEMCPVSEINRAMEDSKPRKCTIAPAAWLTRRIFSAQCSTERAL